MTIRPSEHDDVSTRICSHRKPYGSVQIDAMASRRCPCHAADPLLTMSAIAPHPDQRPGLLQSIQCHPCAEWPELGEANPRDGSWHAVRDAAPAKVCRHASACPRPVLPPERSETESGNDHCPGDSSRETASHVAMVSEVECPRAFHLWCWKSFHTCPQLENNPDVRYLPARDRRGVTSAPYR